MYQAKVTVTTKGRKNDLPVKSGDIVSIIRTTNCPKGKWLAREDSSNTCESRRSQRVQFETNVKDAGACDVMFPPSFSFGT